MKKILILALAFCTLFIVACSVGGDIATKVEQPIEASVAEDNAPQEETRTATFFSWLPFDVAVAGVATDVVVARYIGHRRFGNALTEFEFEVQDIIFGDTPERIFIYINAGQAEISGGLSVGRIGAERNIDTVTDYLLIIYRRISPYHNPDFPGYIYGVVHNTFIDLNSFDRNDTLQDSLPWQLYDMDLGGGIASRQQIISYVSGLTTTSARNRLAQQIFIVSEETEDIILGSPSVLVVEIGEPYRLSSWPSHWHSDWMSTDVYYATVVQILSGDFYVGQEIQVLFFADTVLPGEQHIVATGYRRGSYPLSFTSPHSLFPTSKLAEIIYILNPPQAVNVTGYVDTIRPGGSLQLAATVYPPEAPQAITWEVNGHAGATINTTGALSVASDVPLNTTITVTATATGTEVRRSINMTVSETGMVGGGHRIPGAPDTPQEEPTQYLQLIFTVGHRNFLLNGDIRTGVGAPFLDPATDRMMIPLRTVAEAIDANVRWDDDTRSAVIYLPDETLIIPVDIPLPDGMGSTIIVYDRAFVPLRFVMEALDANAEWDEPNLQAIITFY